LPESHLIQKPRFGGVFFGIDASALCAFKDRGFGGEVGLEIGLQNKRFKKFRNTRHIKGKIERHTVEKNIEDDGDRF
jgi:hypothetical protein